MVTLTRQRHQAQYFIEPLGEGADLEMTQIPAGTFQMRSPTDELERRDSEDPQHSVTVPSFFMGTYPVTQAQWQFVAGLTQIETKLDPGLANFKGALNPVEWVTWHEAMEFCARLAQHTDRPYRLPSEAEWEYACRAATSTPFHFGDVLTRSIANYNSQASIGKTQKRGKQTTPVGSLGIANAFGLYDMHGNVYEWCVDHWHANYYGAPTDGTVWIWDGDSTRRVIRGGSWNDVAANCRSAFRAPDDAEDGHDDLGFRVVYQDVGVLERTEPGRRRTTLV